MSYSHTRISIVIYINRQIKIHGGLITSKCIRQPVYGTIRVCIKTSFMLTFLEDSPPCSGFSIWTRWRNWGKANGRQKAPSTQILKLKQGWSLAFARHLQHISTLLDCVWNMMAHAQKPDFVFRRNGRVHLIRRGRQFSWLLAAEVCASAAVMLDTPCSEVVWRVLATHSIRLFPLHFPSRASPCHHTSTGLYKLKNGKACGHNANLKRLISNPRPSAWVLNRILMTGVFYVCSKGKESLTAGQWSRRVTWCWMADTVLCRIAYRKGNCDDYGVITKRYITAQHKKAAFYLTNKQGQSVT